MDYKKVVCLAVVLDYKKVDSLDYLKDYSLALNLVSYEAVVKGKTMAEMLVALSA